MYTLKYIIQINIEIFKYVLHLETQISYILLNNSVLLLKIRK